MLTGTFALKNFRSGGENVMELSFSGTKMTWSVRSHSEIHARNTEVISDAKWYVGSESFKTFSLPGAKVLESKSSIIRLHHFII